jgi:osmotically-inducible protein OsmY
MERYDQGRGNDSQRNRSREEEQERGRGSWRDDDEGGSQRASGERGQDNDRDRSERSRFSPDWSRQGAQPRYSDEEYYSRNRERSGSRGADEAQQSHYRGYYQSSSSPFSYAGGRGMLYTESLTLHGPYTGRGPKGYKRSDQQITDEACQRLERDGEIDASDIEVTAEDGVIRLRGTVQDRMTKRRAEECVESVYGTRDVMNELRVSSQSSSNEGDGKQGSQSQRSQGVGKSQSQGSQSSGATMRASGASTSEQPGSDKKSSK